MEEADANRKDIREKVKEMVGTYKPEKAGSEG